MGMTTKYYGTEGLNKMLKDVSKVPGGVMLTRLAENTYGVTRVLINRLKRSGKVAAWELFDKSKMPLLSLLSIEELEQWYVAGIGNPLRGKKMQKKR